MRKLLALCFLIPVTAVAQQQLHLTLFGGFSNYQGDLQSKTFTLDQAGFAFGVGAKYDLTPHFALRAGVNFGSLKGDDKKNDASLRPRNLSFLTKLVEGNLLVDYSLFDLEEKRITPYVFAGIAVYHFNPYAFDTLGNKIYLKPLSTEGQGLAQYPDRKSYKLTQIAIPFGGGIRFRISDNTILGYEIGIRRLSTDYLDDVSTRYIDPFVLAGQRGLKAVEMSYRGGELKGGDPNYPVEGTLRGGKNKDWYYFSGITLSITLNSDGGLFGGGRKDRLGCPRIVN